MTANLGVWLIAVRGEGPTEERNCRHYSDPGVAQRVAMKMQAEGKWDVVALAATYQAMRRVAG